MPSLASDCLDLGPLPSLLTRGFYSIPLQEIFIPLLVRDVNTHFSPLFSYDLRSLEANGVVDNCRAAQALPLRNYNPKVIRKISSTILPKQWHHIHFSLVHILCIIRTHPFPKLQLIFLYTYHRCLH